MVLLVATERRGIELIFSKISTSRYYQQAQRTKRLLLTKPFSGADKFVKYTEYVIDNGGVLPELQVEGRNLSFIVYYNLDIFIPLLIVLLIFIYAVLRLSTVLIKFLFHLILSSPNNKTKIH